CKTELYAHLATLARDRGIAVVTDGSNADDRGDYRPGRQAAREHGVRSPLDEAGLTKDEIRLLSRAAGLPTWDEPASACLSSRIPYGDEVTDEKLRTIERAEAVLREQGFRVCRVRHHDTVARLEIARGEMARALDPDINRRLVDGLKALGYQYVCLDLQGYRLGSLNEALRLRPVQ
ncbi:MAG: TIGR00268 family protein, partial [Vicinamibacterales bacterium]